MAQAAQLAGQRAGLPILQTESIVMEAHGHALRKDAGSCSRALRRAETTFSQTTGRDLPAWLSYFDEAYFAAKIAHCFHALEQGKQTEKYALRSLDMDPRYIRGKAFNTALLAIGYALQGELDQACIRGRDAVDLTGTLYSARAITYTSAGCSANSRRTIMKTRSAGSGPMPRRPCPLCNGVHHTDDRRSPEDLTAPDHLLRLDDRHPAHSLSLSLVDLRLTDKIRAMRHVDVLRRIR